MRISGLATGMDTEQIIRDMMQAHRLPMEKITQKKQYLEWQLDDYRSVNRNLRDLAYKVSDTMGRQTTFLQKSVNISNPDAVAIKALSATSEFAGTIEVEQLAKQATVIGGKLESSTAVTGSTKLEELNGYAGEKIIKIQTIDANGELSAVKELKFNGTETINAVLSKINSETGLTAYFDEFTGKIAATAKNSGEGKSGAEIVIGGKLAEVLQLNTAPNQDGDPAPVTVNRGQNAIFTFNGLETKRSSNTFTINGFEITLKQPTAPGTAVTFSSAPDTDKIVESVVKFVDDYNKLIEELNAKIREPKYRNFQPLSDEQKKEMKEKEIELWEEKAKSGTLRNDPTIASLLTNLRQMMSSSVETSDGTSIRLADLGIEPIKDFKENGKLRINEDDLRKAIAADPNKVYELFAKTADETQKGGLAHQFRKTVDNTIKVISEKAGTSGSVSDTFTLGRSLKSMNQQIERFEDRLKMVEDRYWKQFTAMERAIQRANMQSASLMNAFGGM
ncbi:flagellar hook-associated protein 2 [Sporosarcina sp. UB5]|uniref:flagellar hook-associated protein 2 n=1 Tax=Sporosarcina sp. UB5 TaxID=3047463 RepID=UPI003D7A4945